MHFRVMTIFARHVACLCVLAGLLGYPDPWAVAFTALRGNTPSHRTSSRIVERRPSRQHNFWPCSTKASTIPRDGPIFGVEHGTREGSSEVGGLGRKDSLEQFERDVDFVVNDLRKGPDMTIPRLYRGKPGRDLVMSNVFNLEMWGRHTSRWRYMRYLLEVPTSRLIRSIYPQMLMLTGWTVVAVLLESGPHPLVQRFKVPLTPLSLISTFVGALITMRSNQGLNRLAEGRVAWGRVIMLVRDTSQLLSEYVFPVNEQLGLFAARHISMFGWLHKCFLREEDDSDIVTAMLPNRADSDFILGQRKHQAAAISRLRQIMATLRERNEIPLCAHQAIEFNLLELNRVLGMCERIKGSMIPPVYTSHAGRLLVFYLMFLPLALHGTLSAPLTVLVTTMVGYSMLGLDEISHTLECPFRLMPLHQQSGNAMMDSMEAFVKRPPPLLEDSTGRREKVGKETEEEDFVGTAKLYFGEGPGGDAGVDLDQLD